MPHSTKTRGDRLAVMLDRKGISQGELARRLGVSRPRITEIVQGRRTPSLEWLARAAAAIDCDPSDLDPALAPCQRDRVIMASLNISLPEPLREYIDQLVAQGAFKDPSDYVRALVEHDWNERERQSIETALLEGLDSGPSTPMTARDWAEIEREGMERLAARNAQ